MSWRVLGPVVFTFTAFAQAPSTRPEFEVASIRPSNPGPRPSGIKTGHGRLDANNVTLKRCIMGAYGIGPNQIAGGPDWLDSDRFDITAKADEPTDDDALLMVMLQTLLAERFKLVVHREMKIMSAFVLEVGTKGPKMLRAEGGKASTNTSTTSTGGGRLEARNTSMDLFATVLARQMALPVINHTDLEGVFNFSLVWTTENANHTDSVDMQAPSIFTAIQEQLGLRLHTEKTPVEVLVIDHIERPTEN